MSRTRVKDACSELLLSTAECFHAASEVVSVIPKAAKIAVSNYKRNSDLEYLQDVQDAELNAQVLESNLAIITKFTK